MAKITCKFCRNEVKGICKVKGIGVKINKRRLCKEYQTDMVKVEEEEIRASLRSKPAVFERPDWFWDKKSRPVIIEERQAEPSIFTGDPKHPLTGDLSKFFKSTVED
jgi:hypothetical protein